MECGGCTLCCKLLDIPWMNSPAGEYCRECAVNVGCRIYSTAPKGCLDFYCAYNQMEDVSIELRPDKCGIIFERIGNAPVMWGTVETKENVSEYGMQQIKEFVNQGFSVVIKEGTKRPFVVFADGHSKEFVQDAIDKFLEGREWQPTEQT